MRMDWTQASLKRWRIGAGALTWRQRLALTLLALAAVPLVVFLTAGLFLFAVGLGTIVLAGWIAAVLLRPNRPRDSNPSVITTDFVRLSEERARPNQRNPWERD